MALKTFITAPTRVQARRIIRVGSLLSDGTRLIELDHGDRVAINPTRLTFTPVAGDYWVVPSDGDAYLDHGSVYQKTYQSTG
jgi:hypothetical protein